MREIKFRAWDRLLKKMFYSDQGRDWCDLASFWESATENEWHEIMQYTGLKDRNDVEIYESDIIEIDGGGKITEKCQVGFSDGCFIVFPSWLKDKKDKTVELKAYTNMSFCNVEVIGNIHENPELLNDKNSS